LCRKLRSSGFEKSTTIEEGKMSLPLPPGAVPVAAGLTFPPEEQQDLRKMQEIIYSYTVPIIVDCKDEIGIEAGTGVVIEIGPRTFVASAGHVLEKRPHVLFGANPRLRMPCEQTTPLNWKFRDSPDIGFLEVPNNSHPKACFFESLTDSVPPQNTLMVIVGHPIDAPGSLADKAWEGGNYYELVRASHMGEIKQVQDNRYVFAYPKDLLNIDENTGLITNSKSYKTPKGFSGGGLWAKRSLSVIEGVIYPGSRYRLFGLDYAWSRSEREAYCVPIRYWVKLVYDYYPDLHEIIEKKFPKIAEVEL
jgi:hypothetical protein